MYQLHHGDCLDLLPTLPAQSIDAVICDPPYGTTACKWDSVIPFEPMWAQLKRIIKPRGAIVLFGSQPFTSALVMSNPKWYRHEWIWLKDKGSNFANVIREPFKQHESVLLFSLGRWTYNAQRQERTPGGLSRTQYGDYAKPTASLNYRQFTRQRGPRLPERNPRSWQHFTCERGLHPTQKPRALLEYLVKTYTNEGDTVLDFTFGSGTTGHACGNLSRNFIGIEKDSEYFRLGSERIASAYAPLASMQVAI